MSDTTPAPEALVMPDVTGYLLERMQTLGTGNIYAVRLRRDIRSRQGGLVAVKGTITWAVDRYNMAGFVTVWTASHFAGIEVSSVPRNAVERIPSIDEIELPSRS